MLLLKAGFEPFFTTAPERFWTGIGLFLGLSAALLAHAARSVPRNWRDGPARSGWFSGRGGVRLFQFGFAKSSPAHRRRALSVNAIFWLRARERFCSGGFLALFFVGGLMVGWISSIGPSFGLGSPLAEDLLRLMLGWFVFGVTPHF